MSLKPDAAPACSSGMQNSPTARLWDRLHYAFVPLTSPSMLLCCCTHMPMSIMPYLVQHIKIPRCRFAIRRRQHCLRANNNGLLIAWHSNATPAARLVDSKLARRSSLSLARIEALSPSRSIATSSLHHEGTSMCCLA